MTETTPMTLTEALDACPPWPARYPVPPHIQGSQEASARAGDWTYRAVRCKTGEVLVQRSQTSPELVELWKLSVSLLEPDENTSAAGPLGLTEYRIPLETLPELDWQPTARLYHQAFLRQSRR